MTKQQLSQISFFLDREKHKAFRIQCFKLDLSQSEVLNQMIDEFLENHGKNTKEKMER